MSISEEGVSRRQFIEGAVKTTAAMTAGLGAVAAAGKASASPAPGTRSVSANDKIVLGLIGCGGQGAWNMRQMMNFPEIQVAALCDVDDARMPNDIKDVTAKYGKAPEIFKDYRKMLERKDIDAVIVGTPDNWHALNLIHALEAGKDAFCEKPISHDIVEARSMAGAVKRYNKIVQVGTWQRSTTEFYNAINYVRAGKIGKIIEVRAWTGDGATPGKHGPKPVPNGFDYDMWVGPATFTPYVPEHTHGQWRWFLNYGCGMTGDWGVHMMDIALMGMCKDQDLPMPVECMTYGGKLAWPDDPRTAPDTVHTIFKFKDPDFIMSWETGREHAHKEGQGLEWIAADGTNCMAWRGGWLVRQADGKEIPVESEPVPTDHWQNWLDCLKTRQQPRSSLVSMAQTTIVCHLSNASYLAGEPVRWSKEKMDIVGSAGKHTGSYARKYRAPWKLPIYPW
jgi:predicted dehydrogenase